MLKNIVKENSSVILSSTSARKTILNSNVTALSAQCDFLLLSLIIYTEEQQFNFAQLDALRSAASLDVTTARLCDHFVINAKKYSSIYSLYQLLVDKATQTISLSDSSRDKILMQKTTILQQIKDNCESLFLFLQEQTQVSAKQASAKQASAKQASAKQASAKQAS